MLRIANLGAEPLARLHDLNARPGGGTEGRWLDIEPATVTALPAGLEALVVASDLQGISDGELLGVRVAEALEARTPAQTGVLLAGDLYGVPGANKRGGYGDVSTVWHAFAGRFRRVAGVAGNHDDVSAVRRPNAHVLDGEVVTLDGLRIAGVGLICGNPLKPGRRAEEDQLAAVELVASQRPDVLVLHEGPAGDADQPGHPRLSADVPLLICGHCHWPRPLFNRRSSQTLNVDGRVLVLTR